MAIRVLKSLATTLIGVGCLLLPAAGMAQRPAGPQVNSTGSG
jgi:hypothetical protein